MNLSDLAAQAEGKILSGVVANVGHVVINNPERHNAISLDMYQAAAERVNEMAEDRQARLLVIQGAGGKAFASGADISKFENERSSGDQVQVYNTATAKFYDAVFNFPKPTIAKINGFCIGGGLGLAVACDLRICENRSRFAVPAAKLGVGYGFVGVKRLAELVGTSMVKEIFFTARQFSALEAYDMGLINRVMPPEMLSSFVDDYAKRIAANAPLTLGSIKAITQELIKLEAERDLDHIEALVKDCFDSQDYIEGRRAFMEKRKPNFKGK
ncbi:MAG: enoyl-CoA hydratase [Paracoccaceae bacterium]|nr:enoyl-CoA hydratase [Paracoccaceae bacterium]